MVLFFCFVVGQGGKGVVITPDGIRAPARSFGAKEEIVARFTATEEKWSTTTGTMSSFPLLFFFYTFE